LPIAPHAKIGLKFN